MGMAPTLKKVTMMETKINFVKPSTHDLLKDTQDQNNVNYGVRPTENSFQVIITQPISKNLVNGQINAEKVDMVLS